MGVMNYWFFKRASDHEKDQAFYYFRMMEPDFYAYPVYEAVKEQATSPPVLGLGYHQEDHWALRYEGSWEEVKDDRAVLGAYRATDQAGDTLSFTFWGTDLSLVPVRDMDMARLQISLDGRQTILDLHSAELEYKAEVPVATRLPEGEHQMRLTVAELPDGKSKVAIDGIIVRRSPAFLLGRSLAFLVSVLVVTALVYGVWRRWPR